jgi:hypothetical protein
MFSGLASRRRFSDLSEQEVLALAISSEEDDARIYRTYAERLRAQYPASAAVFEGMAAEEDEHRRRLIERHQARFGEVIPLIRREHVAGYYTRKPIWRTCRSRRSAARRRRWSAMPPGSISWPRSAPRTPRPGSCLAIWPRPNRATKRRPKSSKPRT